MIASKTNTSPAHRFSHAAATWYNQIFLFGGTQEETISGRVELSDFLQYNGITGDWKQAEVRFGGSSVTLEHRQKTCLPSERSLHTIIVREKRHHMKLRVNSQYKVILFGGVRTISDPLNDIWEWDFRTKRWREVVVERHDVFKDDSEGGFSKYQPLIGEPLRISSNEKNISLKKKDSSLNLFTDNPTISSKKKEKSNFNPEKGIGKVFGHSSIYYEPWDAMLTYGGWRSSEIYGLFFRTLKPDIEWKLSIARWKIIKRTNNVIDDRFRKSPVARRFQSMVLYDNCLIIFGGVDYFDKFRNDAWSFSLNDKVWTEIVCGGNVPPPTSQHAACLLHHLPEMIIFGGTSQAKSIYKLNLNTRIWVEIEWKSPIYPSPRLSHTMNCLNNGDIILVGGYRSYKDRTPESWLIQSSYNLEFKSNLTKIGTLFSDVEVKFLIDDRDFELKTDNSDHSEIDKCTELIRKLRSKRVKRDSLLYRPGMCS